MVYLQALAAAVTFLLPSCLAQEPPVQGSYVDAKTGIKFATWSPQGEEGGGPFTFGLVLPADAMSVNVTEYIGMLRCQSTSANSTGWCGISHAGHMTNDLLLMAWPYKGKIQTSFRWVGDYFMPGLYQGNASLAQISSSVNATGFELIYRCQNCFSWDQGGESESVSTAGGATMFGFAQALQGPANPGCAQQLSFQFHDNGYGQWLAELGNATSASYSKWAALASQVAPGPCVNGTSA